ncbi:MAG: dihydrodipicolinate synthase family protein [SAR202 cluster bacterium]|nr:dihydrodipicolinate synthase family protein [SAR202 cluster bacterium]
MTEFRGVYPAIVTPMTEEGSLNEEALRQVLEFNIQRGVHGFWVAGGTGESVLLTEEENNRISEICADQGQGRVNNIMHVGANTTVQAARQAEYAARAGVQAICAVPPFFYGASDEAIVEYYRVVGAAADLPLFAYNLPGATGIDISPTLMQKIKDGVPQAAGLKHSSTLFANIGVFAEMGLSCFIGMSGLMLPGLTIGACGMIDGPPCVAPEFWVKIFDAFNKGDVEGAREAQRRANAVIEVVVGIGSFPSSIKYAAGLRVGIDCGSARPPLSPLTDDERLQIHNGLDRLGLLKQDD